MIEKVSYGGWPNCLRIANEEVELIVTTDVGPRVIRYGFIGGQNLFKEFEEQMGGCGEAMWLPRGGHLIWVAPEMVPDKYAPDNSPVRVVIHENGVGLTQPVEEQTGLEKSIGVELSAAGVTVTHRIKNVASKPRTLAAWALSMMAPGGVGVTKFPPRGTHPEVLLPTNPLIMWAFTDLSDPRWTFTKKYLILRQDRGNAAPQKLGHFNEKTMGAYLLGSDLFIKRYDANPSKSYPDWGASYETFTNGDVLELETMGPLEEVAPGAEVEHVERWSLHRNVEIREWTDAELDRVLPDEAALQ
jgi:hypothetical protein